MQDNVSVLLASILAVIIIVLFPIYNIATRQDNISKNMVVNATTDFVDSVRNKGYIESKDYEDFLTEISYTGNPYEVELEIYNPIYIETDDEVYEEKYEIDYTEDILSNMEQLDDSIIKDEVYALHEGDKIYARVKNTNITQAQVLLDRLFSGEVTERIVVNYGGIVYSNEWAKAGSAQSTGTNISISRPMNYDEKEFKYEMITNVYDQYTGEYTTIYGLAVKLDDTKAKGDQIKFRLKYEDIKYFLDKTVNEISNSDSAKDTREENIAEYINTIGFEAYDIQVFEDKRQENTKTGTYDYEYIITLSAVSYNFANNAYLDGMVQIKAGSAETKNGTIGLLNSEEFIIIYEAEAATTGLVGPKYMTGEIIAHENNILRLYDKKNNKLVNVSGIPVRINENPDIKFTLSYNDIVGVYDAMGIRITSKEQRQEHIKKYINIPENWKVEDIIVTEKYYNKEEELSVYNAEYEITLKGISYELDNSLYIETYIEIAEGSVKIKGGEKIGALRSQDFIILDESYLPTIELIGPMDYKGDLFGNKAYYQEYERGGTGKVSYGDLIESDIYEYNENREEKIKKLEGTIVTLTRRDSSERKFSVLKDFREQIKFTVIYNRITGFVNDNGDVLTEEIDREEHIKKYIALEGFSLTNGISGISVSENSYIANGNGTYNAEYTVTLENIEYNTNTDSFKKGKIIIKAGCAQTFNYSVGEMSSEQFIITYAEIMKPQVSDFRLDKKRWSANPPSPFSTYDTILDLSKASYHSATMRFTVNYVSETLMCVYKLTEKNGTSWHKTAMKDYGFYDNWSTSWTHKLTVGNNVAQAYAVDADGMVTYINSDSLHIYSVTERTIKEKNIYRSKTIETDVVKGATIYNWMFETGSVITNDGRITLNVERYNRNTKKWEKIDYYAKYADIYDYLYRDELYLDIERNETPGIYTKLRFEYSYYYDWNKDYSSIDDVEINVKYIYDE